MYKVSVIGAGNVGATAAMKMAIIDSIEEIVLLDIKDGIAEGKAMDIMQCALSDCFGTKVIGVTNDYAATANSDVIVVTSGVPRKPGMTREDLVNINAGIVSDVVRKCDEYSHYATYVIVSNPMDTMTLHAINTLKKTHPDEDVEKFVIGMGGLLDSSRFRYFIWKKLNEKYPNEHYWINSVKDAWVIGGHGDATMIPYIGEAHIGFDGKPITDLLTEDEIAEVASNTMKGGSTLTNLLGTSAWEAPGACIADTVGDILYPCEYEHYIPCSIYREDLGCCIGTLTRLGNISHKRTGIIDYKTEDGELIEKMKASAELIKKVNEALPKE